MFATQRLVRDIYRDSTDPGAAYVLESGARLPQRRTLVDLFDKFAGLLLVLQGAKDPLNDAVARAKGIEALCEKVRLKSAEDLESVRPHL